MLWRRASTPEARAQASARAKVQNASPEARAQASARAKVQFASPEARAWLSQQERNRPPRNGKEFKGTKWIVKRQKFIARIRVDGKRKNLGAFVLESDAARAYNRGVDEHWNGQGYKNRVDNIPVAIERRKQIQGDK
jgi:hypothetical protein